MLTVWKYELPYGNDETKVAVKHTVMMPLGANILSVIDQNGHIVAYVEVDTEERQIKHTFYVSGTGHNLDDTLHKPVKFVGSVKTHGNQKYWHVYSLNYGK